MKTIQSIDRSVMILEYISENNDCRLVDICTYLDLNKSTVHGIISTLEFHGLISKDPVTSKYSLGSKIFQLGMLYEKNLSIKKVAKPYLHHLVDKFSETAHLAVFSNYEALYVDKVESPYSIRMTSIVGTSDPLATTAIGKCILANISEDNFDYFINTTNLNALTDYSITDKNKLLEELNMIKKQGFALDLEELEVGLNCIAVPIKNSAGEAIAAISISAPSSRFNKEILQEMKNELVNVCNQISARI